MLLLAAALGAASPARADLEVYRARHRPAEELLPLARTALAGEGDAALDAGTQSLVLSGDGAALARALALLAQQDRALRNVVIHYETRGLSALEAEGVRVVWQVDTGSVRVGNAILPGAGTVVAVRPGATRERERSTRRGTLRVLEGRTGEIAAGAEVPVVVRRASPWVVEEETSFASAESGLRVTPRVLDGGRRVRLELEPFEARLAGATRSGPAVERSGAATSIEVAPGETVVVGGLAGSADLRGADAFSGAARERRSDERVFVVRVELD